MVFLPAGSNQYDNIQYFEALSQISGFRGSGITQKTVKNKVGKLRKKLNPDDGQVLTDSTTGKKIEVDEYENVKIGLEGNVYVQTWEEISTDPESDEEEGGLQRMVKPMAYPIAIVVMYLLHTEMPLWFWGGSGANEGVSAGWSGV